MKRFFVSACALVMLAASTGCVCNCPKCRNGIMNDRVAHAKTRLDSRYGRRHQSGGNRVVCDPADGGGANGAYGGMGGATVGYPYYTVRGPRDFLAKDPRGIGP